MREFTKSMFSYSWAMSLFGIQQMINVFAPSKATKAFDNVTGATTDEFGSVLNSFFRTGDSLQRGMVDLTFGLLTPGMRNGNRSSSPGQADSTKQQASRATQGPSPSASQSRPPGPPQTSAGWNALPSSGTATATQQNQSQPTYETDVSPEFPYEPHYIDVFGSKMHYIEQGSGDPILFIHGNGTWSYIWRNVIPHLSPYGRCIALDLIGFGRSGKPDIDYSVFDHARYIEEFINKLGLRNITLVLNDMGVLVGLLYGMHHEDKLKAIAFFEGILKPFPSWSTFSTPQFRGLIQSFRTGGIGGEGWKLLVDQNLFIERLLPNSAGRPLTEKEMNYYREPFLDPASRKPIWRFPRSVPIEGEPQDVLKAVTEYSERLQRSGLPKLLIYSTPGAVMDPEIVEWSRQNIRNLEAVNIGPGIHFLQESSPRALGRELARWYRQLDRAR